MPLRRGSLMYAFGPSEVKAVMGDPDVYVCNRNTYPQQNASEHTWKSQQTGDDVVYIPPHDPLFFPGPFYIGVWSMKGGSQSHTSDLDPTLTHNGQT